MFSLVRPEHYQPTSGTSTSQLGDRLRHSRRASGLKTQELADQLGVTTRALRHWETGRRHPSDQRVAEWARLTGFPLAWFYRDPEEEAA